MKTLVPLVLTCLWLTTATSCQKFIDRQKEKMAMDIITDGDWYVEQYIQDTTNVTSEFLNYLFHFHEDRTVTGTLGTEVYNGTWEEHISDISISSQFPTAPDPVKRLNGKWKLKDSSKEFVKAEMITATGTNYLRLRKNP
jgi:hypothetical protein